MRNPMAAGFYTISDRLTKKLHRGRCLRKQIIGALIFKKITNRRGTGKANLKSFCADWRPLEVSTGCDELRPILN